MPQPENTDRNHKLFCIYRYNGVSKFGVCAYFPGHGGHFSDVLIDVQIDSAHYNSKAARAARRRRALGIIFGSLKCGPWRQPHFRSEHVCVCVCANNIQQKQVSLKLLLYCSFMSVILPHKKMFYFIRSFSFAPAAAVGVIHFVLQ
jgi:hypothetical protein